MVIIYCPRCSHVFGSLGPPVAPIVACPACGQSLRLRPKAGAVRLPPLLQQPAMRRARGVLAALLLLIAAAVGIMAWRVWDAWSSAARARQVQPLASSTAPADPPRPKTAYQQQEELARRAGRRAPISPDRLFAATSPAVVRILLRDAEGRAVGQGSGFLVSRDGWIVTNYHVIDLGGSATAMMEDYTELPVEGVAAVDRESDLALLKAEGHDLPCLLVDAGLPPAVGRKVYAIGSPRGLVNTLSEGLISGHRQEGGLSMLQTTAPMGPGSSGGPLLTEDGAVVGVGTQIRPGGQNLNFAIPAERIRELLQRQGPVLPLASLHGRFGDGTVITQLDKAWRDIDASRWEEARAILSRLARAHPENPHVWLAWGDLCRRTGLYKSAVQAFEAALKIKPDYAEAHYHLGQAYMDQIMLAEILDEHTQKEELAAQARQAFLRAAEFDPAGKTGRDARAALARHWPREFNSSGPRE